MLVKINNFNQTVRDGSIILALIIWVLPFGLGIFIFNFFSFSLVNGEVIIVGNGVSISGNHNLRSLTLKRHKSLTLRHRQYLTLRRHQCLTLRRHQYLTLRHHQCLTLRRLQYLTLRRHQSLTLRVSFLFLSFSRISRCLCLSTFSLFTRPKLLLIA